MYSRRRQEADSQKDKTNLGCSRGLLIKKRFENSTCFGFNLSTYHMYPTCKILKEMHAYDAATKAKFE